MPGERLDAEWVRSWWEQADAALTKLTQSFFPAHGFPPGHNAVLLATDDNHRAPAAPSLQEFLEQHDRRIANQP
ncbi:hypothetical protein [Streptomyces collinus]|uniref:hypothetical protein n=1 Tax=Streptomyces collinus TaxID=42684 RepID=UPI00331EDC38